MKGKLSQLIGKSTHLRCSTVIVGDCSLKLLRQDIFLAKLKEFLSLIGQQWTREQLALLALRIEFRQLETLHQIIKSVNQETVDANWQQQQRQSICNRWKELFQSLDKRKTVASNDTFVHSLQRTLEMNGEEEAKSYDDLVQSSTDFIRQFQLEKEKSLQLKSNSLQLLKEL